MCYNLNMRKKKKSIEKVVDYEDYNKYTEVYNVLSDEVLTDIGDLEEDYQRWIQERKAMLPLTKDERDKIEAVIKLELLKMWKKAKEDANGPDMDKGFFRYEDILSIPYVKDFFNILTANGDRNIGKTYSSRRIARDVVKRGKRWAWIRNIDDEVKAQVVSDEEKFLAPNGWAHTEGTSKAPNITNLKGNIVGYYRPLNTSAKLKSIEFPDVELMVYEEFNEVVIPHKFLKMVKLASTMQRHEPNFMMILQANYVDQNDEILRSLGVGSKTLTKEDFVIFNWELGALVINIPKGIYRQPPDKSKDTAYRASLGSYEVWKSQYGGGFSNEEPINIVNENEFSSISPVFNIYMQKLSTSTKYGAHKLTLYKVYDKEGKMHNVITTTKGANSKQIFVVDYVNKIQYPSAEIISLDALEMLISKWNNGNLKTTDIDTHKLITAIFARALQKHDQAKNEIEDIENMVS